ncbi:hypothetical protein BLA29_012956, partial [Euroglyphus maynei]
MTEILEEIIDLPDDDDKTEFEDDLSMRKLKTEIEERPTVEQEQSDVMITTEGKKKIVKKIKKLKKPEEHEEIGDKEKEINEEIETKIFKEIMELSGEEKLEEIIETVGETPPVSVTKMEIKKPKVTEEMATLKPTDQPVIDEKIQDDIRPD